MVATICAWLLPGLGHWILGQRQRAVLLAVSIGLLWLGGLLIGGVGIISHQNPAQPRRFHLWYLGQMLTAPSIVVEQIRVRTLREAPDPSAFERGTNTYEPSFGRASEQGALYTALAGLLNLLAIIDVLYREPQAHGARAAVQSPDAGVAT